MGVVTVELGLALHILFVITSDINIFACILCHITYRFCVGNVVFDLQYAVVSDFTLLVS